VIIYGVPEPLLATEVLLGCLNGNVAEQELDLFEFTACLVAKPRTGSSQVVRCDGWQTAAFRARFHNSPDDLGRKTVSPDSACLVDGPQQWTSFDAGAKGPAVDRFLYSVRNGNRPDMATFSSQICDNPMAFKSKSRARLR
jgi:hypothetical protein